METTRRLAIFRINFKSDFVLTLQSDAGWNIPFCIKFWTSIPTRAYYAGWDGTTYTHCAPVAGDSSKLQVQFDDHNLPIGELKYQIGYHFTVDDFPNDPEDEVINQEAVIIDNNGQNEKVLLDFNGETAPDIQFSLPAYANEAQRIANEEQRIENEQARILNEETRTVHEWERQRNEQTRIAQEEARERAFTQMQRDSESATRDANDAATLANSKARLAQEKAEYAQQQGDFAKAQGETAQLDHTKAAADHQTALADHQTAAADHQTALADHQTAAADHQTAESDHTRAGQDHTDIQNAISAADLVYDISKAHASGGVLATYADLSAALGTNGANVPVERRQGGMTVQFVRSSDNSYVQYRYMLPYGGNTTAENTKFVNVGNWQGVDDKPMAGSDNLVKSGGIHDTIVEEIILGKKHLGLYLSFGGVTKSKYILNPDGTVESKTSPVYSCCYQTIPVNKGAILHMSGQSNQNARLAIGITTTPITESNFADIVYDVFYNKFFDGEFVDNVIVPYDGYIIYYRFTTYWDTWDYIKIFNSIRLQDNSVIDISELNNTNYAALSNALAAVPTALQKGGMEIRFRQIIPATYSVAVTESDTEPTGTALNSASSVTDGTYTANQLSDFSTLPSATGGGNAQVYYFEDSGTYTIWTITMATAESSEYVQYRLMTSAWSTTISNWQGVDSTFVEGSRNLIESGALYNLYKEVRKTESDVFKLFANTFEITLNEVDISDKIIIAETNKGIQYADGNTYSSNAYNVSGYIDVSSFHTIRYSRAQSTNSNTPLGIAFYDKNRIYISGQKAKVVSTITGYESTVISVPSNAYYVRLPINKDEDTWGLPYLYNVIGAIIGNSKIDELEESVRSLDTNVENLDTRIETIEEELHVPVEMDLSDSTIGTENKYIDANGVVTSLGSLGITGYIECAGFKTMDISVVVLTTTPVQYTAFYDVNKHFISGFPRVKGTSKGSTIKTYNIPNNAVYFRATYYHEDEQELYGSFYCKLRNTIDVLEEIEEDIDSLDSRVTYLESLEESTNINILKLTQQDIVELNVIVQDGTISQASSMGCTDYIPCKNAEMLIYAQVVGTTGAGLAFYDANKDFISYVDSVTGTSGIQSNTISVPDNAEYFRASGWNYANSQIYGAFFATLNSPDICVNGKRASNGECTYFSVFYNKTPIDLSSNTFDNPCLGKSMVCTTAVVLLPSSYTLTGKPSRVIVNYHGWSHYVNYKQWGAAGASYAGFMIQKQRWADAGYVVIDVNHKNSSQKGSYSGLGSTQDDECYKKAVEWVRNNYNVEDTCFIVCGSAGGPNGINACYNWPDVRAGVWLDTWIDVADHPYVNSCGTYYYGYTDAYDATKVGTRNPATHIQQIGDVKYLTMPKCPVILYPLTASFMDIFVSIINAGHALNGDYYIRRCSGITHSNLVSGGDGTDPQSAIVDEEIINFLDQH